MEKLTLQKIKVYKKVCGIYKIKIHDKEYIGSSKNIQHRLRQHLITLKQNKHHNHTMQNLYNKYGIDNIYFEVIEICLEENRINREKYYIDSIKPYINHILDPENIIRDKEYKHRISISKKKYYETHSPVNIKMVYQYSLEGKYLQSYKSITDAARATNQDVTAICSVCNNRSYTAGGYRWSFELKETLSKLKKKYKKVPVIQYSLDNVFIKEWDSKTDAEKELKICNISRAIRKNLTAGGYKWKYKI